MKKIIPYEELDNHFITPKGFGEKPHFHYNKFPRKLKKRLKVVKYHRDDMNVKLWLVMQINNPNYHRFLIKKICEKYDKF